MKLHTTVCARFESKGKPHLTEEHTDKQIREVLMALAKWTTRTPMGSYIKFTLARTPEELERACNPKTGGPKATTPDDLMDDFEAMLAQEGFDLGDESDDEPSLLGDDQ